MMKKRIFAFVLSCLVTLTVLPMAAFAETGSAEEPHVHSEEEECTHTWVLDAVLKRESLGSTGLEHGIAIPHAKVDFIHEPVVALAVGENEIDFSASDGKPTQVYFLVLGSDEHPSEHVQVLSQIAQISRNSTLLRMIRSAKNRDDLIAIFF